MDPLSERDLEVETRRKEKADARVSFCRKQARSQEDRHGNQCGWQDLRRVAPSVRSRHPEHPEKGIVLGFWMGKDSKDHPLGERGSTGGPGFAESGARNWVHSAATVLAFLQKERGLLKPGYKFQPIMRDDVLR